MSKVIEMEYDQPQSLSQIADGAETQNNAYQFTVPSIASNPIMVKTPGGLSFSWRPTDLCYKDENENYDYIVGSSPTSLSVTGTQARYKRTFPLSDDIFNAEPDRIKHYTVMWEKPREAADYLSGNIYFGISGLVTGYPLPPGIHESISTSPFILPKPTIKDLTGNEIEGFYEVVDTDNGQQLFIWFDASYLDTAVFPVTVDPTVVVSSGYTVSRNGRPQKLSNGWLVVGVYNTSYHYFYKSQDNGTTWTQLCWVQLSNLNGIFAICSYGTIVHLIACRDSAYVYHYKFDAITVSNANVTSYDVVDTGQSDVTGGCDLKVDADGVLYAVWSSKNPTYPASFNLRFAKSIDGGTN